MVNIKRTWYKLNVVCGENGSGKSRMLRFIYNSTRSSGRRTYFLMDMKF